MAVVIQYLHFRTSFPGPFVFIIFLCIEDNTTVSIYSYFPIILQVKVIKLFICNNVSSIFHLSFFFNRCIKVDRTISNFPGFTNWFITVLMPAFGRLTIKEKLPTVFFLFTCKYIHGG